MDELSPERYLSASVREYIEQAYYARVNEQAKLEHLIRNPFFMENAAKNPAFFSDHGVVHVRDVAKQILRVLRTINGVLIPQRSAQHMELFLYGYGVALAYLHDTVDSFWRAQPIHSVKSSTDIQVLLESTDDDPRFAELVQEQLCQLHPHIRDQIHVVPSLRNISEPERTRYLEAKELDWDTLQRQSILDTMQQAGQKVTSFDPQQGFRHVRFAELRAGEKLIEAGAPATFVYIPLGDGLKIIPLGGYQSFSVAAWMPLGTTGVIRGDTRNADIIAEQHVALLIIPKEVYLRYWYDPYSPVELMRLLSEGME